MNVFEVSLLSFLWNIYQNDLLSYGCKPYGVSVPQMTTSRSHCFTVTRFIKSPIKYIFYESLINNCTFRLSLDIRQEMKPFAKIAIISQRYVVSQIEFVSGQNLTRESKRHPTLGYRGYFFLIDIWQRSRVNEAQSAEEKKITSGHRSTQPHFHARNQFRN